MVHVDLVTEATATRKISFNKHYEAAIGQLKAKLSECPLKVTHSLEFPHLSKDVIDQIAFELTENGITAKTVPNSFLGISYGYYISVEIPIPKTLRYSAEEQQSTSQ